MFETIVVVLLIFIATLLLWIGMALARVSGYLAEISAQGQASKRP